MSELRRDAVWDRRRCKHMRVRSAVTATDIQGAVVAPERGEYAQLLSYFLQK